MIGLFVILTLLNLVGLILTAVLGYGTSVASDWGAYHQLAGVLSTLTCCAVHCIVFTYFIATAKWVQHAASVGKLDEAIIAPTRSFKAQAFPAAMIAMFTVFLAAVTGVLSYAYHITPQYHLVASFLAIVTNMTMAWFEYRSIRRNGRLIRQVIAQLNLKKSTS